MMMTMMTMMTMMMMMMAIAKTAAVMTVTMIVNAIMINKVFKCQYSHRIIHIIAQTFRHGYLLRPRIQQGRRRIFGSCHCAAAAAASRMAVAPSHCVCFSPAATYRRTDGNGGARAFVGRTNICC